MLTKPHPQPPFWLLTLRQRLTKFVYTGLKFGILTASPLQAAWTVGVCPHAQGSFPLGLEYGTQFAPPGYTSLLPDIVLESVRFILVSEIALHGRVALWLLALCGGEYHGKGVFGGERACTSLEAETGR